MHRPPRSPQRREIYVNDGSCQLGFIIGFSISATIFVAYYSRFINLIEPFSSIM